MCFRLRELLICAFMAFIWPLTAFSASLDIDRLVDAIYVAEGGSEASVPYGLIYSDWCIQEAGWCEYYAKEIVRVHLRRCTAGEDEIECVGRQYAPVSHDPINENWVRNVRYWYERA